MKRILIVALCVGGLAACQQDQRELSTLEAPAGADASAPVAERSARSAAPGDYSPPANVPLLAYRYLYRINAPAKAIGRLVAKHEAACQAAGPSVCQVTETSVSRESQNTASGRLSLRARPDWLEGFRAGLAKGWIRPDPD